MLKTKILKLMEKNKILKLMIKNKGIKFMKRNKNLNFKKIKFLKLTLSIVQSIIYKLNQTNLRKFLKVIELKKFKTQHMELNKIHIQLIIIRTWKSMMKFLMKLKRRKMSTHLARNCTRNRKLMLKQKHFLKGKEVVWLEQDLQDLILKLRVNMVLE